VDESEGKLVDYSDWSAGSGGPRLPLLTIQLCFRHVSNIVAGTPKAGKTNLTSHASLNATVSLEVRLTYMWG